MEAKNPEVFGAMCTKFWNNTHIILSKETLWGRKKKMSSMSLVKTGKKILLYRKY